MNYRKLISFAAGVSLALAAIFYFKNKPFKPTDEAGFARTSVMVTRLDGRSGGTGVILSSSNTESKVLTNAHVCGVVEHGGMVTSDRVRTLVSSYQVSQLHDLCLITVNADLGVNTAVATDAPNIYSTAQVSGHPSLLPNIITKGHFSQRIITSVLVGFRPCEQKDLEGDNAILCMFLGGIPIIKTYEAQVVSATIMPGSSGSAVFNSSGEIAGLVFAGSGQLSYGMIVPQEYVYNFVKNEVKTIDKVEPSTQQEISAQSDSKSTLKKLCREIRSDEVGYNVIQKYCSYLGSDMLFETN